MPLGPEMMAAWCKKMANGPKNHGCLGWELSWLFEKTFGYNQTNKTWGYNLVFWIITRTWLLCQSESCGSSFDIPKKIMLGLEPVSFLIHTIPPFMTPPPISDAWGPGEVPLKGGGIAGSRISFEPIFVIFLQKIFVWNFFKIRKIFFNGAVWQLTRRRKKFWL